MSELLNACRFNPVQCTDAIFQNLNPTEGYVYFVTDKKKLYLGKNGKMLPMCSSSGFFYGIKEIAYDNSGILPDPHVVFDALTEIEGEDIPEKDDLILNKDGCFYRVNNVVETALETTRLTLQGTGTGGGGGDSPGGGPTGFTLQIVGSKGKVYSSTATTMNVPFICRYNGTEVNAISQVSFTRAGDSRPFYTHTQELPFNQENNIDLREYMHLFDSTNKTVTISVQDLYGSERNTTFTIQIVTLSLTPSMSNLLSATTTTLDYTCKLAGATSGVSNKQIVYTFYHEDNLTEAVVSTTTELAITEEGSVTTKLNINSLPHGVYEMHVQANAYIASSGVTLESNTLIHKVARFDTNNNTPLLLIMVPKVTEQYTNIPLEYLLVSTESTKEYTLDIKLNGETKTQLAVAANQAGSYNLYFEDKNTYTLLCTIIELAISYDTQLIISAYTGNLPVINPNRDDLILYLSPRGKSNEAIDRDRWTEYNNRYTAQLSGLHYGNVNGWLIDEQGVNYLKLSSGASLSLPDFKPFAVDPSREQGMTIELDFEISGVLDYDTELIKCVSTDKDGVIYVGFSITGDKFRFYNSRLNGSPEKGALTSLNLIENKRIRISFIIEPNTGEENNFPMCYTYLNGILSGAVIYDTADDAFVDSVDNPARFSIVSSNADIKIYGIRVYSTALTDRVILNNYTATLPTLEERQARYDTNNVFNAAGEVEYTLVSAEEYNLQIPYMKITGGWATEKDSKWQLKNQTDANVGLPTGKKDYRLIDVEVKYPKNSYFANYKDYKFTNTFDSGKTMATAYGEKPSNGGAIMYAQGTSSMEYPVKNLRLRFKEEENWYTVRPDIAPVEIICMKADYMESSGSHNTGAANLVDALYTGVGIKTPGQSYFGPTEEDKDRKTIVTCIKGHPCLIFYSETGAPGSYKYIGKYNLNLDKATPEPFGFDHNKNDSDFGYLEPGDKYYEIQYDDEGKYVEGQIEIEKTVSEGETVNSIHCFEFLDNAVEVCNFLPKAGYNYEETWYGTFVNKDNERVPGWTLGFESRYPEDRVGYHDADALYPLASWLNALYNLRKQEEEAGKSPTNISYTYNYTLATVYEEFVAYYIKDENDEYIVAYPSEENFANGTYYTRTIASSRFEMDSLERFKREYHIHFDKEFLLTYYLVTEALLMADSRVKNMMIATWGKETRTYKNLNDETLEARNYIFYPIFYDMDTMLGLDNTGVNRFNYYDEDTNASVFNGDEVLWNFVRDALVDELAPWYNELESATLTANKILPYFNANQANMANEAFYNGDAMYKYITPAREGYDDHLNDKHINPGEAPYLYAAQGDRSLMREWFLTNRMKFLRGKYNSSNYQSGDRIEFRWYYPSGQEDEFTDSEGINHGASVEHVEPNGVFNFTSLKTGYSGVKLGANGNVYNMRFNDEETKQVELPEASSANGTEAYLLGLSNLTDLGDLSNKYMQKFIIASDDVRLKHLTLGNPHKDYYNPYWKPGEGQSQKIGLSGCTYLETFNLQNCATYNNTLDFSNSPAIQRIYLTGSGVTGITLPNNGQLKELRLPTTVSVLRINSHSELTDAGFSLGTYSYDNRYNKIGEGEGYYVNDFSKLKTISIINTPIDTYNMVIHANSLDKYCLQGIDWTITENDTQYCARAESEVILPGEYYYYENGEYKLYTDVVYPTEGRLYEKVTLLVNNDIVAIPALDYLSTKIVEGVKTHAEALTGKITISITGQVNELSIYEKYKNIYPNIEIQYDTSKVTVEGAQRISFYSVDYNTVIETGSLDNINPMFTTLTANEQYTLAELINNNNFTTPIKTATNTKIYEFTGIWYDWDSGIEYYQDAYFGEDNLVPDASRLFSQVKPKVAMRLVPKFKELTRYYTVTFYNYDGSVIENLTTNCEYEDILGTHIANKTEAVYLYRNDDTLAETERYTLKGWQSEGDYVQGAAAPILYNLDTLVIRNNLKLYAYYIKEDVITVPTDNKFFNFNTYTYNGITGYCISIKNIYRNILQGKITLPNVYNNEQIIALGDFKDMPLLTHIYFINRENNNYTIILNEQGFARTNFQIGGIKPGLQYIALPSGLQYIGDRAFMGCAELENIVLTNHIHTIGKQAFAGYAGLSNQDERVTMKVHINQLPSALHTLGEAAFQYGGSNVIITSIPDNVITIEARTFSNCPGVNINQLGGGNSKLATIKPQAFYGSCNGVTELILGATLISLAVEEGYGSGALASAYKNVIKVITYSTTYNTREALSSIGLNPTKADYELQEVMGE